MSEIHILHISKRIGILHRFYFGIYKKYWRKEIPEGATQVPTRHQSTPPPPRVPWWVVGALAYFWCLSSCTKGLLTLKKTGKDFRDGAPPSRGRTWAGALFPSGGAISSRDLPSRRGKSKPSSSPTTLSYLGGQSLSTSSTTPSPPKP